MWIFRSSVMIRSTSTFSSSKLWWYTLRSSLSSGVKDVDCFTKSCSSRWGVCSVPALKQKRTVNTWDNQSVLWLRRQVTIENSQIAPRPIIDPSLNNASRWKLRVQIATPSTFFADLFSPNYLRGSVCFGACYSIKITNLPQNWTRNWINLVMFAVTPRAIFATSWPKKPTRVLLTAQWCRSIRTSWPNPLLSSRCSLGCALKLPSWAAVPQRLWILSPLRSSAALRSFRNACSPLQHKPKPPLLQNKINCKILSTTEIATPQICKKNAEAVSGIGAKFSPFISQNQPETSSDMMRWNICSNMSSFPLSHTPVRSWSISLTNHGSSSSFSWPSCQFTSVSDDYYGEWPNGKLVSNYAPLQEVSERETLTSTVFVLSTSMFSSFTSLLARSSSSDFFFTHQSSKCFCWLTTKRAKHKNVDVKNPSWKAVQ